jgi:acetyltransferase-like isoleucine patch superfamily enzyme
MIKFLNGTTLKSFASNLVSIRSLVVATASFIKLLLCSPYNAFKLRFGSYYIDPRSEIRLEGYSSLKIEEGFYISRHSSIIVRSKRTLQIGCNFYAGIGSIIDTNCGDIEIGDNVSFNHYSVLYGHGGVVIGSDTRIAAHVVIIPANHRYADRLQLIREQGLTCNGINIDENVWVGTKATILDGVNIGKGAVIGASALVTKDVPEYTVAKGVPARCFPIS